MTSIAAIRKDYKLKTLDEKDVSSDPFAQFGNWWNEAMASNIEEVNAMTLCTVDAHGRPQGRIVLLKNFDAHGFVFFTNYESNKAAEIATTAFVSLVFFWKELERQVRITGSIEKVPAEESETYFHSRPVASQLGALASPQSKPIANRQVLEDKMQSLTEQYNNKEIPRPAHWGGYIVTPDYFEFWQGRSSRLHDRITYAKKNSDWLIQRLAP